VGGVGGGSVGAAWEAVFGSLIGPSSEGGRRLRRPVTRRSGRVLSSAFIFSTIKCNIETVCAWLLVLVSRV
jgi:hypothetical protein